MIIHLDTKNEGRCEKCGVFLLQFRNGVPLRNGIELRGVGQKLTEAENATYYRDDSLKVWLAHDESKRCTAIPPTTVDADIYVDGFDGKEVEVFADGNLFCTAKRMVAFRYADGRAYFEHFDSFHKRFAKKEI